MMIIERLRLDMSLPPLTDKVLAATAGSWLCHLDKARVPIERFDECYAEAIAIRATQGAHQPFHVSELVGAWHAIRERERYSSPVPNNRSLPSHARVGCSLCFGVGSRLQILPNGGARPCPECWPEMYEAGKLKPEWSENMRRR
jgi:hypothetical protein